MIEAILQLLTISIFLITAKYYSYSIPKRYKSHLFLVNIAYSFVFILFIVLFAILFAYLFSPVFLDHLEPVTAEISWLGIHGGAIYPHFDSGRIYEAPYGPLLFLLDGCVLVLLPYIIGFKLIGCMAFLSSLYLVYVTLHAKAPQESGSVLFCALFCYVVLLYFHEPAFPFWSRAEPFLILLSTTAILVAQRMAPWKAAVAIGALAGLCSSLKLHGAMYTLPAFFSVAGRLTSWRARMEAVAIAGCIGLIAMALTFSPLIIANGWAELSGYIDDLTMTSQQGLRWALFIKNIVFSLVCLTPIFYLLYVARPCLSASDKMFLIGLLISLFMASIVGSVAGAGTYHLLPLIPAVAYSLLSVVSSPDFRARLSVDWRIPTAIFLISFSLISFRSDLSFLERLYADVKTVDVDRQKADELLKFQSFYHDAEIGISDNKHYTDYYYRILSVFRGWIPQVDFTSLADFTYAGRSDDRLVASVNSRAIRYWILPLGVPFSMDSPYTPTTLMTERFRSTFLDRYEPAEIGRFFQVWACR